MQFRQAAAARQGGGFAAPAQVPLALYTPNERGAGLKHLAKLTRLEALFLNGIALSDAAVAELKRKLPKANIVQ